MIITIPQLLSSSVNSAQPPSDPKLDKGKSKVDSILEAADKVADKENQNNNKKRSCEDDDEGDNEEDENDDDDGSKDDNKGEDSGSDDKPKGYKMFHVPDEEGNGPGLMVMEMDGGSGPESGLDSDEDETLWEMKYTCNQIRKLDHL